MTNLISKNILYKLLATTGLATIIVVGSAGFGFWSAWKGIDSFDAISKGAISDERAVLTMANEFRQQVQEWKDTLLRGKDPAKLEKYWGNFLKREAKVQQMGNELHNRMQEPAARKLIDQFIAAHKTMGEKYREGLAAFKASGFNSDVADQAVAGMDRAPTQLLEKAASLITARSHQQVKAALQSERNGIVANLIIMLVAILVAFVVFTWIVQKLIVKPSRSLREDLARLASGDFTQPIVSTSKDEVGQIADSARQLQQGLGETIGHLTRASHQVADSSRQLTEVAEQTSEGVSQQREQTEMVATAVNEMVATVQEVTRNASQAAESAHSADQEARNGKQVLNSTTESINLLVSDVEQAARVIHELEEHSNAIGSVLDVIRGIAEQTNLLALNAAIEAARAGEQGRGFAVVADEVRTLAQRTQQSTSEIQSMIEQLQSGSHAAVDVMSNSRSRASSTVEHANEAAQALDTIVSAISTISDMNAQIATAAEEQSAVAEEIGRNITTISQAAEQSAQSVEHTARSSEELAGLANQLQQLSQRFQI